MKQLKELKSITDWIFPKLTTLPAWSLPVKGSIIRSPLWRSCWSAEPPSPPDGPEQPAAAGRHSPSSLQSPHCPTLQSRDNAPCFVKFYKLDAPTNEFYPGTCMVTSKMLLSPSSAVFRPQQILTLSASTFLSLKIYLLEAYKYLNIFRRSDFYAKEHVFS